mgnify:CR=1 FL=1
MLVCISPAKKLDWSEAQRSDVTTPDFSADALKLAKTARDLSAPQLQKLMSISENLARLNYERFVAFSDKPADEALRPAALAFAGDTYQGLEAASFSEDDMRWAQDHLRILSGLYGLLRPLDLIQPYRLEMGTKVKNANGKDLYDYWGSCIAESIEHEMSSHRSKTLINLASNEYFKSVQPKRFQLPVITPVFKDFSGGTYKVLSFFAKKARGSMTSFIVKNRISKPEDIKSFDVDGYVFNPAFSTEDQWVFTRKS